MILWLLIFGGAAYGQLQQYRQTLESLSEPAATRWQHFATPYFSTNEKLLNKFYPEFDNAGGVTVGVSFQQNLSLLVHAKPQLCVIFDYNPGVTEILVPFMGQLISESPSRHEFLSTLVGVSLTEDEANRLIEGRGLAAVLGRADPEKRQKNLARLRHLLRDKYAANLPTQASQAVKWIDILENEELLTGAFFSESAGGWLATEQNYGMVRSYWMAGRIIGVTGDISGTSVSKVAAYLRARKLEVSSLYLSNVGISIEGHFPETWFRDLYRTLAQLPLAPNALTLIAQGPWQLTGFVRSFKQAQWVYEQMASIPEQIAIRLHEAPLEMLMQRGPSELLPSIRQGLTMLKAPRAYFDLLQKIQSDSDAIQRLSPDDFRQWCARSSPAVDIQSPIFQTILVTLTESNLLAKPWRP